MTQAGRAGRVRRVWLWCALGWLLLALGALSGLHGEVSAQAGTQAAGGGRAHLLTVQGAIGPATTDYLVRGLEAARTEGSRLVILKLDTPGGLDTAMRDIIQAILNSPVPVATYVSPSGARAASAGTYILYASHVAAMAPGTNLGAATPVQIGGMPGAPAPNESADDGARDRGGDGEPTAEGESAPDGAREEAGDAGQPTRSERAARETEPATAMERKLINDAVAYIRELAELRGRNADWAERAVREGASLGAGEAIGQGVIDVVAESLEDLLLQIDGRSVRLAVGTVTLETAGLSVEAIDPDWRNELLSILTNPNVAYILMLIGIYGIIFELANPGAIVPGVIGGISLLLALFAFQALPINHAGFALMVLGLALMVAEAFAPSFGILGIGGVVAFIFGSLLLVDTGVEAFELSLAVVIGVGIVSALVVIGVSRMAFRAWRRRVVSGAKVMLGQRTVALDDFRRGQGQVRYQGEIWGARCDAPVRRGQSLRVVAIDGLNLTVEPAVPAATAETSPA
jgi:membrane-bound serine protease (ClpP class)